jgi:hypothetical protein
LLSEGLKEGRPIAAPSDYIQRSNKMSTVFAQHTAAGVPLTRYLLDAGEQAVDLLKLLLEDEEFWAYLKKKRPEGDTSPDPYSPVVAQYHAAVLRALGYQPPPPSDELAGDVAKAIAGKRGGTSDDIEQVRQRIVLLKDRTVELVELARKKLSKKGGPDARTLGERLKRALHNTKEVIVTAATVLALKVFDPIWPAPPPPPPPPPPPIVIVVPSQQLPPGLQRPPPGATESGPHYFYRALPPPPDVPPGSQKT